MKKEVRRAIVKAKEIERIPEPTKEEITKIYKEGMEEAENLKKLLKPEWFVKDIDRGKCRREHMKKPKSKRK